MTRLQKKCFLFSASIHGLLAVIVILSAAFRGSPEKTDFQVLTLIPAQLLDGPGAGAAAPTMATARPQPPQPIQPPPSVVRTVPPTEPLKQQRETEVTKTHSRPEPADRPIALNDEGLLPKPTRKRHEIKPDFTPVEHGVTSAKRSRAKSSDVPERSAMQQRMEQIQGAFAGLASNVRSRAGEPIPVGLAEPGGSDSFAGYESAIYSAYYPAWSNPQDLADHLAYVDARIVVARDGSILSWKITNASGHRDMDRSVEQVLRSVTKLPPFPETARDPERTFLIRFNLEAKLSSG